MGQPLSPLNQKPDLLGVETHLHHRYVGVAFDQLSLVSAGNNDIRPLLRRKSCLIHGILAFNHFHIINLVMVLVNYPLCRFCHILVWQQYCDFCHLSFSRDIILSCIHHTIFHLHPQFYLHTM